MTMMMRTMKLTSCLCLCALLCVWHCLQCGNADSVGVHRSGGRAGAGDQESAGAEIFEVMRLPLTSKDAACCHTYGCT